MTPRENFISFFKGADYEWVPSNMDQLQFRPAFIPDNVARGFVAQQHNYTGPFGGKDMFGVEWIYQEEQHGSMEAGHLFDDIEDWREHVVFPNLNAMDWEKCAEENKEYLSTDKLIYTTVYSSFFERLISFVGFADT
ncbi:MAG: methyltransferase, partial [Oscillospiraceae bacterium]|nr:methyltransferase [Oscillospiraceae bacterium]